MRISIDTFNRGRDLDAAAALLAGRQQRDRAREPLLPARYEDPAACRELVAAELDEERAVGVIARAEGEPVGFMVMTANLFHPTSMVAGFFPSRPASIGYAGHAAREDVAFDATRAMYAALADDFVRRGFFDHLVYIAPRDPVLNEAWASLGFGRALTAAIRGVEPVAGEGAPGVEVHAAAAEDAEVIFALNDELSVHHSRAPIFMPLLREAEAGSHEFQRSLLAEPEANPHFVAYRDGVPVAMNTFMAPGWISRLIAPEKTIYLYQGVVSEDARGGGVGTAVLKAGIDWARSQGYEHVALHFASANIPGARFWQGQGFRPVEHRYVRHIDERIAWARE
jgi:GNAT superfamily N-acetyltransferase